MRNRTLLISMMMILSSMFSAMAQEKEITLSADSLLTLDGKLDSIYRNLPEVMIVGERPIVKAQKGKLVYDLSRIIQDKPVDNIYDAVKELPGVTEMNGSIQLAGQPVSVVIDGKVNTLSAEQLTTLLQSMPAGSIENAEVLYNAPAKYQVRGALINITLKHSSKNGDALQGELYAKALVRHDERFEQRASAIYNHGKLSMDFLYSHRHGRNYNKTRKDAVHTLNDGEEYTINNSEFRKSRGHTHSLRLGTDYKISEKSLLSLVYNGSYSSTNVDMETDGTQTAYNFNYNEDWLHNIRLDYVAPFYFKVGAEMTYYNSPSRQTLKSEMNDKDLEFNTTEGQRINRWKFYMARDYQLESGWGVNYGAVYTTSNDNSYQYYKDVSKSDNEASSSLDDMKSKKREQTLNMYAGFNKSFGSKISLDASLALEQYKTSVWNQWDWYPTFNLNYLPAEGHVLQLSLSSDKDYPDYWAVQNAISFLGGGYSEIHGNPLLKPSQDYEAKLTYILRGKYVFSAWFQHAKDYSTQTLYQSSDRLTEIYKYLNFDFQQQAGVQVSMPLHPIKWVDSRLTLIGVWHHEKDADFWDIPFDRRVVYGMAVVNNTFTLSKTPDLRLTVHGMIMTKAIQGIYDLPVSGCLDFALRYSLPKGNGALSLYCEDLFETDQISPYIMYKKQNVTNHYSSFREVGITFTYRFGAYKEKKREDVDTSRFK